MATLRHARRTAASAMSSGPAASDSRSISRDFEMSEFWQNRHARLCPRGAERQHRAPRQEVVERLLLDRIYAETARPTVRRQHHLVGDPTTDEAQTPLALTQPTRPRADIALHPAVVKRMPIPTRHRPHLVDRRRDPPPRRCTRRTQG